jgi:2-amino-4-hydroxy-6-hydroxymethyldihydropteridine diphosphokinase
MQRSSSVALVLALGSNLGDRLANLRFALRELQGAGIRLDAFSSVFETPAIGSFGQPPFLNMVASASTDLPPHGVLSIFHAVERRAGRTREFPNAPRTLDLDLLFLDGMIVRESGLRVPHPRWKERSFVVLPLVEIAPGLRDPETGLKVHEVARLWPMEPREIRMAVGPEAFETVLKEWTE